MRDSPTSRENVGNGRSVVAWVALLFVLTFVGTLPLIVGGLNVDNLPQSSPLLPLVFAGIVLTAYAPSLAALLVAGLLPRAGGGRALLSQIRTWRVRAAWYLLVLIGPMVLILIADVIYIVLGGTPPKQWLVFPSEFAFLGPLLAGSLGEELGWRGFALPRLQHRYGALWASIMIGVIWSTWHLWPIITPGGFAHLTPSGLAQTYIRLISTAIIYAWLYNSTNGSLFLVMVAHAGHNIAIDLIQIHEQGTDVVSVIIALLYLVAAIAVVLMTRPQALSRSNSGK
jgi:membrane protease YdiL (CAAX protease family)